MSKKPGHYPLTQIIHHNPSVKEAPVPAFPTVSRNAVVTEHVRIADNRFVAPGQAVYTQEQADALPDVPEKHKGLNAVVVDYYYRLGKSYKQHTPLVF